LDKTLFQHYKGMEDLLTENGILNIKLPLHRHTSVFVRAMFLRWSQMTMFTKKVPDWYIYIYIYM